VNVVEPSLIRVEADEVTYNLHIMLRFEIEAGLIEGSIAVADLPELWNQAMKDYLGIVPPNDAQGVLQDVHWSMGYVGYFPSYMLGNLYAAQMLPKIRKDLPTLDADIRRGDMRPLLGWLRENVHRHGATYEPNELIERITGHPLDPAHFVRYVKEKYSDIYGL
jgi:carboxypeptidase Taq